MANLSELSELSQKIRSMGALIEDYQSKMAINSDIVNSNYGSQLEPIEQNTTERKFTMFEDIWVSSPRKVGR